MKRCGKSAPVAMVTWSAVRLAGCKAMYILIVRLLLINETARFVSGCTPGVRRGRLHKINDKTFPLLNGDDRTRLTGLPFLINLNWDKCPVRVFIFCSILYTTLQNFQSLFV